MQHYRGREFPEEKAAVQRIRMVDSRIRMRVHVAGA